MVRELEDAPRDSVAVVLDVDARVRSRSVRGAPRASTTPFARRRASFARTRFARAGCCSSIGTPTPGVHRVRSLGNDWDGALDALAAVEPSRGTRAARARVAPRSARGDRPELVVVTGTARGGRRRARRPRRGRSPFVRSSPSTRRRTPVAARRARRPALLRLAAAGVALAVVRHGVAAPRGARRAPGEGRWLIGSSSGAALAAAPAVAVVVFAWAMLEEPVVVASAFAAAAILALVPSVPRAPAWRAAATAGAGAAALSPRVRHVAAPRARPTHGARLHDAPVVQAPFDPAAFPSLHGLVVAGRVRRSRSSRRSAPPPGGPRSSPRRSRSAWASRPSSSRTATALRLGAARARRRALGLRRAERPRRASRAWSASRWPVSSSWCPAAAAAAGLAPGRARTSTGAAGTRSPAAAAPPTCASSGTRATRGIDFPVRPTVVLRIRAPARAQYWRMSTLDTFAGDRWIEHLYPVDIGFARRRPACAIRSSPRRDGQPGQWLEAAGDRRRARTTSASRRRREPARIDGRPLGHGLVPERRRHAGAQARPPGDDRTRSGAMRHGPTPRALAASPPRYPAAAGRYLELGTRAIRRVRRARGARRRSTASSTTSCYRPLWAYRPLWQEARRLTAKAHSPYEATLVLERWFRDRGGFRYEEHPLPERGRTRRSSTSSR